VRFSILTLAALWDPWTDPQNGEIILSVTMIVGPANDWMSPFHNRQPTLLYQDDIEAWLSGSAPDSLLTTPPNDSLREWIVSPRVNKSRVGDDDPSLVAAT